MKATIYYMGTLGMGVSKIETRVLEMEMKPYAQYPEALWLKYVQKRKRTTRQMVQSPKEYTLILEGHGHPEPDGMFGKSEPSDTPGITVSKSRYSSCDPRWQSDFEAMINPYILENKVKVLAYVHDNKGLMLESK